MSARRAVMGLEHDLVVDQHFVLPCHRLARRDTVSSGKERLSTVIST